MRADTTGRVTDVPHARPAVRVSPATAVLAALALAGCAGPAPDAAGPALRGSVTADGRPVAGVIVTAERLAGGVRIATVTGADGRFAIPAAFDGAFRVTATAPGRAFTSSDSVHPDGAALSLDARPPDGPGAHPSAWWLGALPDGEAKRKFILDCTGCHQFNETRAVADGAPRTRDRWRDDVTRMLGYAGARSGFPVIAADRVHEATADWLTAHLARADAAPRATLAPSPEAARALVTEFDLPVPPDLPHDVAVDDSGRVLVTGMFTHQIYVLDPATGGVTARPIPVDRANPRAIEVDGRGRWWVLLGQPMQIARYDPVGDEWRLWSIGMYPHSVAIAPGASRVWFNGHFTRDPEQIGVLDTATDSVATYDVPRHPALAGAGGPLPYEQRLAPDGSVWLSELQGNRMIRFDPADGRFDTFTLPTTWSGPRRFDVGPDGSVWIPAYAANALVRLDPATGAFDVHPLPAGDCLPYVARVDARSGVVWIGTAAADAVLRFDPGTGRFSVFPVPTRGATMRHMALDPERGDVWIAYGASPAIHPARIARLRVR